jgi:DNA topoisomerase I
MVRLNLPIIFWVSNNFAFVGKPFVVVFDFLGKDSIRYYNEVPVEKRVFKNLQLFMENKANGDDLFDRLNVS